MIGLTLLAGMAAGLLGALLGLGGGVIVVPLLDIFMGHTFATARAASLVGVLTTSSTMATSSRGRRLFNPRLATTLLVFSVGGATIGARLLGVVPEQVFPRIFGVTALLAAATMLARLGKRNVLTDASIDTGAMGGRFVDADTGLEVAYRVRRLPLACLTAWVAGMLASFVGVGGGILVVPILNAWCGVPMRVAAATSAWMIGITALPGVLVAWGRGDLADFETAAAISLGTVAGYPIGAALSGRAPVQWLKLIMSGLLLFVAWEYLA